MISKRFGKSTLWPIGMILLFSVNALVQANDQQSKIKLWVSDEKLVTVPAPTDVRTNGELQQIKDRQAVLSDSDRKNIQYWAAGGPNYRWSQIILERYAKGPPSPFKARGLKLLNLAIYDAVAASENAKFDFKRKRPEAPTALMPVPNTFSYPSSHAAAGAAAAGVLAYLFPEEASLFAQLASEAANTRVNAGINYSSDITAGMAIGKNIAEQIIAYAMSDNSDAKFSGERPTGPGNLKGEKFVYPAAGQWAMTAAKSVDHYLPEPPPAYDSADMKQELLELKKIERTTPHAIRAWINHSTYRAFQWWYEQTSISIFENNLQHDALKSAHIYAVLSVANGDSGVACFNAKYKYWLIRPAQLDKSLKSLFPSPPHPSYPSAHSCSGASYSTVLAHYFPERAEEFAAAAHEGGYSRLIAGIHYPADHRSGSQLGEAVANDVIEHADALLDR